MEIKTTTTSETSTKTSATDVSSTEIPSETVLQTVTQSIVQTEEATTEKQANNIENDKSLIVPMIVFSSFIPIAGIVIFLIVKKRKA